MKKILLSVVFALMATISFACHYSYLTLNSGPTPIGGGLYSTDVTVCIGQKQNWGGTDNFTLCMDIPIVSAGGANYPTVTNTYNICGGPCGPTQPVTASATGTISGNCITYNTTTSTPAGYPLVPDRYDGGAGAAGNSNSFCFTITIVTNGYPTSLQLGGNVESEPGVSGNDGNHQPCNGNGYEPNMTINFPVNPLPIELIAFDGEYDLGNVNLFWASASESNNEYYTVDRSLDGYEWIFLCNVDGAGNSNQNLIYRYVDRNIPNQEYLYYRLTQTDYNGQSETFKTISVKTPLIKNPKVVGVYDFLGKEISNLGSYHGFYIIKYDDGTSKKMIKE